MTGDSDARLESCGRLRRRDLDHHPENRLWAPASASASSEVRSVAEPGFSQARTPLARPARAHARATSPRPQRHQGSPRTPSSMRRMVGANAPHRRARARWEGPPRPAILGCPLPTRLHHHEVVDRTTRDLDCFGPTREAVDRLWPAIRDRLLGAGLDGDVHQSDHGFAEMSVIDLTTGETTQVDVGFHPATQARSRCRSVRFGPWRTLPATSSSS